ncbi:MAG: hypothetical protein ACOC10_04180, partial [Bacteroidota bacterium]
WFFKNKKGLVKNVSDVLKGRKTWVGYYANSRPNAELPVIKPGVLSPADMFEYNENEPQNQTALLKLNVLYARNYSVFNDAEIVFKNWHKLDK